MGSVNSHNNNHAVQVDRDLLECPVCFEIPAEGVIIYQCRTGGHTICAPCSRSHAHCPQCGVRLNKKGKIRNWAMEALVAGMTVGCKFEVDGCAVRMPRKDVSGHQDNCQFRPINICKILGFPYCNFVSRPGWGASLIYRHLLELHGPNVNKVTPSRDDVGWLSSYRGVVATVLERSLEYMKRSEKNRMTYLAFTIISRDGGGGDGSYSWASHVDVASSLQGIATAGLTSLLRGEPVNLRSSLLQGVVNAGVSSAMEYMRTPKNDNRKSGGAGRRTATSDLNILVAFHTNVKQGDFSVICLHFGQDEGEDPGVELTVEISASRKNVRWSWSGKPIYYMKSEYAVSNPPFKIPIRYLLDALKAEGGDGEEEEDEELKCKIYF